MPTLPQCISHSELNTVPWHLYGAASQGKNRWPAMRAVHLKCISSRMTSSKGKISSSFVSMWKLLLDFLLEAKWNSILILTIRTAYDCKKYFVILNFYICNYWKSWKLLFFYFSLFIIHLQLRLPYFLLFNSFFLVFYIFIFYLLQKGSDSSMFVYHYILYRSSDILCLGQIFFH